MKKIFLLLIVCMSFVFAKEDLSGNKLLEFNKENLRKVLEYHMSYSVKNNKIDINKLYSILSKECKYIAKEELFEYSIDPYEEKNICYFMPIYKIVQRLGKTVVLGWAGRSDDPAYIEFPNVKLYKMYSTGVGLYDAYSNECVVKSNGLFKYTTVMGETKVVPKIKVLAILSKKSKKVVIYH